MVLLIHGDAAFAGEGVVQETLNLSQLSGYAVGGTLHIIVNNQLGFTTSPSEARSAAYPTEVAKMLQIPIFHVNGEHPEAVAQAVELAMAFRAEFQRDVVIDMFCYRRLGHNEGDEPSFTQPLMYQAIEHRESVREGYLEHLLKLDGISREEAKKIAEERHDELGQQFQQAQEEEFRAPSSITERPLERLLGGTEPIDDDPETGVPQPALAKLLQRLTETPEDFHLHRKLKRGNERRRKMAAGEDSLDWASAEALAIATLAVEGHRVRISGQDTPAEPSVIATLCCTTLSTGAATQSFNISQRIKPQWRSSIAHSAKSACWGLSMAIVSTTPVRWSPGRPNMATLPTPAR